MRPLAASNSRLYRCLLMLAMLAWVAFAVDAVAQPMMMSGAGTSSAATAVGAGGVHGAHGSQAMSASMAHGGHHPGSSQPTHDGHGSHSCGGGCCSFPCGGMVAMACFVPSWQPLRGIAFFAVSIHAAPGHSMPLHRPPIA